MMRKLFYILILILPLNAWANNLFKESVPAKPDVPVVVDKPAKAKSPAVIEGDEISFLRSEGKAIGKGHVKVTYQDVQIFCNQMVYDQETNIVNAIGDVKIVRAPTKAAPSGSIVYGKALVYNLDSKTGQMKNIRIESIPFYDYAKEGYLEDGKYILKNGYVSTCDHADPHYRLTDRKIIIYPKDKIVAKNVWLKVGSVPVFYIPYYSQSLNDKFPVEFAYGHKSNFGTYILTGWRYRFNGNETGKVHIDWYEDRGEGVGLIHNANSSEFGKAFVDSYFIKDRLYSPAKAVDFAKDYPDRLAIPQKYLNQDRYKEQIFYKWNPAPKLTITANVNKFSDENFMKDYFYHEYQVNPTQNTYLLTDYAFTNASLSTLTQIHANNFTAEKEYLPQLNYNLFRQQLGDSKVYLQSNTLLGEISQRQAYNGIRQDSGRVYSTNILSRPFQIKWLHIDNSVSQTSAFYNKDTQYNGAWSTSWQAGTAASVRFYKLMPYQFNLFGQQISAMRHVFMPTLGYNYIRAPIGNLPTLVPFDDLMNFSRSETISLDFDNTFQVKSKTDKWNILYFNPTLYYHIRDVGENGVGDYFSNIYSKLEFYPLPGKGFRSEYNYDLLRGRFNVVNGDIFFSDNKYSVAFGQRYTQTQPSQSTFNGTYQLTSKIKLLTYEIYNNTDRTYQEQEYGVRFDLHCWWMDVDFDIKHSLPNQARNVGVWVQFSLKGFETKTHLGFDHTFSNANKYSGTQ